MSNRQQFVELNNVSSTNKPVRSGVPQGSVIGPLLFSIYISDMGADFSQQIAIKHYADDTIVYAKISSTDNQLELDNHLQKISLWCDEWQMELNASKTLFMRMTRKKDPLSFSYSIKGTVLTEVKNVKYLGVHLTHDLNWSMHVDSVCNKAMRKLWSLRRKLHDATPEAKTMAYKMTILPVLTYASHLWEPYTKTNALKCERIQNKALRFIFNSYSRTQSISELRDRAGLMTVKRKMQHNRLIFFFQILNGDYKVHLKEHIALQPFTTSRTKHSKHITPLSYRTDLFKYSFLVRSIDDWNQLPQYIVEHCDLQRFEKALSEYL